MLIAIIEKNSIERPKNYKLLHMRMEISGYMDIPLPTVVIYTTVGKPD